MERLRCFADKWKNVISAFFTAALIALVALLFLTNRDNARTVRLAERPWVGEAALTDGAGNRLLHGNYTITTYQPLDLGIAFENFGKSPTPMADADYDITVGGKVPNDTKDWTPELIPTFDCRGRLKQLKGGPLFPSVPHTALQEPSKRRTLTVLEFNDVKAGRKTIFLRGCAVYRDADTATLYETDICMHFIPIDHTANGYWFYCPLSNAAD